MTQIVQTKWFLRITLWAVAVGFVFFDCRAAAHKRDSPATWATEVRPILASRCAACHSEGGFGGIALNAYDDARRWAKQIRAEVLARRMPPWPAAPGYGDFVNDRSLSPVEVELLTAWTDGGMKPGVAAASLDSPLPSPGDTPDLLLQMTAAQPVTGHVAHYQLQTGLKRDRWITGWEFRPGNAALVEHAIVSIAGQPFAMWTPGDGTIRYAKGIARRLPARALLDLEVHYRKATNSQTDRSGLGLYFGPPAHSELRYRRLPCGSTTMDTPIDALAITPGAPAAGDSMKVTARGPDGSVKPMVVVPRYEPAYPITYRYREPMRLPRGTIVQLLSPAACSADLEYVEHH